VEESDMTDTDWIVPKGDTALCLHLLQLIQCLEVAIGESLRPRAARGGSLAATLVSKVAETPDGCHQEAPTSDCYATQHNPVPG